MKLHFRPMPGLTIVTAICLAILISLGTWQYQRLQWKTGLLAEIEVAATAPPLTSVLQVQDALDAGQPVDFRRIEITVEAAPIETLFRVFHVKNKKTHWRIFFPAQSDGEQFFVAHPLPLPDIDKDIKFTVTPDPVEYGGYVRVARPMGRFKVKSSPEENRWFGFNPMPETANWSNEVTGEVETRFYIDAISLPGAVFPLTPRRPDIRNNHLDYMLTWYSFAIILLIIYFILHYRAGRLGYKNS